MKATIFEGANGTGKTRTAFIIETILGKDKVCWLNGKEASVRNKFLFDQVTEKTELIIIDDCPKDFIYEKFMGYLGEGYHELWIEKRGLVPIIINAPKFLFITDKIPQRLFIGVSNTHRYDVVKFPLYKLQ